MTSVELLITKSQDIDALKEKASNVSALLKILSHPNRLLIACALTEGEANVSALEAATGAPQPHLSRDLARLRAAGLVSSRRESKNIYYRLADDRLARLIAALCDAFGPPTDRKGTTI
ncbi:MAG: metalloregulator ArsR/SmtB family transcription factor [Pseudomonadota bacterium]